MNDRKPAVKEPSPPQPAARRNNRFALLALLALFVVPILAAAWLSRTGERATPTSQHGELLQPRPDLRALSPTLVDGSRYDWAPTTRKWRIAVAPPAGCGDACDKLARQLDKVWRLFGRKADRVHILWLCPTGACVPPDALPEASLRVVGHDPALRTKLPRAHPPTGVPVYVIDPYGYVILRYPPGFDPAGLRADLAKLLKLM